MNPFHRAPQPSPAYTEASTRAAQLWDVLDKNTGPRARQAVYDTLSGPYAVMAAELAPAHIPAGYDGNLTADLMNVSVLCWVLARSEHALACDPDDQPEVPYEHIPGASTGDARLAAAWRLLWETSDRDVRAVLLRGHQGHPARRGEQRQPGGIIPLTAIYAGSAVTGFLEQAADSEEHIAALAGRLGAAR